MTVREEELAGASGASDELVDVVVIGGGQADLAMAWHLARQHLRFVVLEAGPEPGHIWRSRWDSLTLFTPAQYDALPGVPFPGPPLPRRGRRIAFPLTSRPELRLHYAVNDGNMHS